MDATVRPLTLVLSEFNAEPRRHSENSDGQSGALKRQIGIVAGMNFHVAWHRRPECIETGPEILISGVRTPTLHIPTAGLTLPWSLSFEEVITSIERLDRMFAEPDGSFVWRQAAERQIDGQLYDCDGRLLYVELSGNYLSDDVIALEIALNPQRDPLVVQLLREGVVVAWEAWLGAQQ